MSEHEHDTAVIERELGAIDAALSAGAASDADADLRELQELALMLRADAPETRPAFERSLRERVEAGFPRERRALPSVPRLVPSARRLLPVMGGLAAVLLVAVVIVSGTGGPGSDMGSDGGGGGGTSAPSAGTLAAPEGAGRSADEAGGAATDIAPVPPAGDGGFVPGQRERRIERSIALELEAPADDLARVADQVTAVTNRHGGFVLSSSVSTGQDGSGGDFELRIPADRLRPAIRDLAELATVRSQSQSGRDITRDFVTAADRLQAARAERRGLLRRLANADTDREAEAIRARLELVAGAINGLHGQLRDLRLRTDYAVVSVSLAAADDGSSGGAGGGSFDDALGDAGHTLVAVAAVTVRVLAVSLPIGLVALVTWLAAAAVRRRRRESALV